MLHTEFSFYVRCDVNTESFSSSYSAPKRASVITITDNSDNLVTHWSFQCFVFLGGMKHAQLLEKQERMQKFCKVNNKVIPYFLFGLALEVFEYFMAKSC